MEMTGNFSGRIMTNRIGILKMEGNVDTKLKWQPSCCNWSNSTKSLDQWGWTSGSAMSYCWWERETLYGTYHRAWEGSCQSWRWQVVSGSTGPGTKYLILTVIITDTQGACPALITCGRHTFRDVGTAYRVPCRSLFKTCLLSVQ